MSGTDIFLSYARKDRPTARVIAECLAQEGFTVWWDASLHSGETFDEVIERNLKEARAVVVLWSPASVASRWVRAEATLADRRNKLVPAIIEACDRPIIFELTHTAELNGWTGDMSEPRWRQFVLDLRRLPGMDVEANRAETQEDVRSSKPEGGPDGDHVPAAEPSGRRALRPGNDEIIPSARSRDWPVDRRVRARTATPDEVPSSEVHCLEVESADFCGDLIIIDQSGVKIGRSAPADIVLTHRSISREHCIISIANDELFVTDLNSTNGTYIDDERVGRTSMLPLESVVRLGEISLRHRVRARLEAERLSRDSAGVKAEDIEPGRVAATS